MATVVVTPPFQVVHDGQVFLPGQTAEVPDAVADKWRAHGWVEDAPEATPPKPARTRAGRKT